MRVRRVLLLLTVGIAGSLQAQSPIHIPTSCLAGKFVSGPPVTLSINVKAGQTETRNLVFDIPSGFTGVLEGISWTVTSLGQPAPTQLNISPQQQQNAILSMRYPTGGKVTVRLSLAYRVRNDGASDCSATQDIQVNVENIRPLISDVRPALFTACAPRDVSVAITGSGFVPSVGKVYLGNSPSNFTEVPAAGQSTETRLDRVLPSSFLTRFPTSSAGRTFFVVSNDPTPQIAAELTSDPFYVNVRATPTLDANAFSAQGISQGFRTISVTGANFTADTVLILVSNKDNQVYLPTVQNLNGAGTSFSIPFSEATYQTGGPFTARVVNREEGNPINPSSPAASYYADSCSPFRTLSPGVGAPTGVTLNPSSATACGPQFNLEVTASNLVTTAGAPRLQVNNVTSTVPFSNSRFAVTVTTAQLGSAGGRLTFGVANQTAANAFSAFATNDLTILAPPAITSVPAVTATGNNQNITLTVNNLTPTTGILLQRSGQADTLLIETGRTANTVTVTVPGSATVTASPNALRLVAVNGDAANPARTVVASPPAGCPTPTNLAVQTQPGVTISQLVPNTEFAGRTSDLPIRVQGTNFRTGATVLINQESPVSAPLVNGELQLTLPASRFATVGTIQIRVQNSGDVNPSGLLQFTVAAPRAPTLTLAATPSNPASPSEQPRLTLTQSNFSERALTAVFSLEFQPDGTTGVSAWPATAPPLFPNNSRTMSVAIPTAGAAIPLPNNGQFSLPFAAGMVTVRLTSLTVQGTQASVMPVQPVAATATLNPAAPTIDTTVAPLFNRPDSTGTYWIDLNAISNPLNLTNIVLRFNVAGGTQVDGNTSFTFDRTNSADLFSKIAQFFRDNLATGGQFRLRFPLTISSGNATAIQSVTVQFTNSAGQSSETRIDRQ